MYILIKMQSNSKSFSLLCHLGASLCACMHAAQNIPGSDLENGNHMFALEEEKFKAIISILAHVVTSSCMSGVYQKNK
jgi:uncharacterized protein (UPF0371 family)